MKRERPSPEANARVDASRVAAAREHGPGHPRVEVAAEARRELRLVAIVLDDLRQRLEHAADRLREEGVTEPATTGFGHEFALPILK